MLEIRKSLIISTAHIPIEVITEPALWAKASLEEVTYGYQCWVPEDFESRPAWLQPILKLANENDCSYVVFDQDGELVDGLPEYDA